MAWFDNAGAISGCVAAYAPCGAASLADSYVNEANPGTNNAAPGVAPTWDAVNGWAFNGMTQYLTTGITPIVTGSGWSALVRFSAVSGSANNYLIGASDAVPTPDVTFFLITRPGTPNTFYANGAAAQSVVATAASGVLGFAGTGLYRDGSSVGTYTQGVGGANSRPVRVLIGAVDFQGTAQSFLTGSIQAVAIYNTTLTAPQVLAITNNMNALPNYSEGSAVAAILQAHGAYLGDVG